MTQKNNLFLVVREQVDEVPDVGTYLIINNLVFNIDI